jgi:hypothetical protein
MAATTPKHGRFGVLYLSTSSTGAATNFANAVDWTFNADTPTSEVTCIGDSNQSFVAGIPNASGAFNGIWDSATASIWYAAARDGLSRKMYLYPGGSSANYWYGDVLFSFSGSGGIADAVKISGNWSAAGAITPIGVV